MQNWNLNNLPHLVALDYETCLVSGEASVDFFRDDFRVKSCSFSWKEGEQIKSLYTKDERSTLAVLRDLADLKIPLLVHNIAFEYGVTQYRFPYLNNTLIWSYDTMRLVQVLDNGGKLSKSDSIEQELGLGQTIGLSLSACVERCLDSKYHNHKEPYYKHLREVHGIAKKKEGANLHLLSDEMLEEYNTADTEITLRLFYNVMARLKQTEFDPHFDHFLYLEIAKLITLGRGDGVLVDRPRAEESLINLENQILDINTTFRTMFSKEIEEIEKENLDIYIGQRKTQKGQTTALTHLTANPKLYQFNTASSSHKKRLFIDKLGLSPKFLTAKGKPSFAKHFLGQWGEGGNLLIKRGSVTLTKIQIVRLLEKISYDEKWHIDLMAAGTTTGRFKGAGGLNIQAMARKEESLMGCIIPEKDNIFVSVDLAAGEPTITTEFSKDTYYHAATFGMVGKKPYYDENNVLMIDDIYLMGMSVSPMGKEKMIKLFYEGKFDGLSFSDAWIKNPDLVKNHVKLERAFHKILILGLSYSMGPKHMVESAFKAGYSLTLKDARGFFKAYWALFKDVKKLGSKLESEFKEKGHLVNSFGYRLIPEPSYKALNYFIQSSVSGLINCLCVKFFSVCKEAKFVTVIHDEIIFQIPIQNKDKCKELFNQSLDSLNEELGWSVKVRCGWKEGNNLYEAK